jgi:hypothetical protein
MAPCPIDWNTNPYGKASAERAEIITYTGTVEPLLRAGATAQIDTAQMQPDGVADELERIAGVARSRIRLLAVWSQDRSAHESFSLIDGAWSMLRLPGENLGKPLCGRLVLGAFQSLRDGRCDLCCC